MFNREKFFNNFILNTYLNQSCKFTQGQVYRILYELHKHGLLWHLDDNPAEVGRTTDTGEWMHTFTTYEATILSVVQPAFFSADLPDFGEDPHEICCDLTRPESFAQDENEPGATRTLPRYRFYFEDDPTGYIGFTEPKTMNGSAVGAPLLAYSQLEDILKTGGYTFTIAHREFPDKPAFNRSVFTVTGTPNDGDLDLSDHITIEGEFVLSVRGDRFCVYDTSPMGWDLFIDFCVEENQHDWEGYL